MKKEDVLLRLIAVSGELPAGLVGEIVESESYAAALITRLKKENYISVRNAGGYKGYVLRSKGKRYLLEKYEDDLSFFLSGSAQTNHVKSEPEKRLRLHRMSEVWVFFWKMGIEIFQSQKPDLGNGFEKSGKKAVYYGSLEYKESAEAIKGSRACGVLTYRGYSLCRLQHHGKKNEMGAKDGNGNAYLDRTYAVNWWRITTG
ncbi:MAG: hypothetical protein ACLRW4_08505 [Ruminococcus sp.]